MKITKEQKKKALELIAKAKELGEGMDNYDSMSSKFPREAFEDLYYKAKALYCEISGEKDDFNTTSIYWHYDGDWYFEAENYTEKLKKILKENEK